MLICFFFHFSSAGIEKDAVSIYTKYISFDASHPIGISDELRNETTSKSAADLFLLNFNLTNNNVVCVQTAKTIKLT